MWSMSCMSVAPCELQLAEELAVHRGGKVLLNQFVVDASLAGEVNRLVNIARAFDGSRDFADGAFLFDVMRGHCSPPTMRMAATM
jgi:hypothetical protein